MSIFCQRSYHRKYQRRGVAQWYFGMKLLKKFQHIILTLPKMIYRHQMKIIERVRNILHDLALIYTLCYVPKIGESKG